MIICLVDSGVRYLHSPISKIIKFITFMIRIVIVSHKSPRCLPDVQSPTHEKTAPPTPKNTFQDPVHMFDPILSIGIVNRKNMPATI